MKNSFIGLLALAATISCGGCFPYHFTTEQGAKGRVVDARTGAPVSGAKVELSGVARAGPDRLEPRKTTTATDGSFAIPAKKEWGMEVLIPFEFTGFEMTLDFSAPGYENRAEKFHASGHSPAVKEMGDVKLKHQP